MYALIGLSLVSLLAGGDPTVSMIPAEAEASQDWPAIKRGIWSIEGTLMHRGNKKKKWKASTRRCDDAATLFQGYWGRGKAEKNDCLFQSTRLSGSRFEIVGECLVEQNDVARSESTVVMKGDTSFQMKVRFQQGKVSAQATETGRWVSACTDADRAAVAPVPAEAATATDATAAAAAAATSTPGAASKGQAEASR